MIDSRLRRVSAAGSLGDVSAPNATVPPADVGLSLRETEVLTLITLALSNQEIADRTFLSINSVKSCICSLYRKTVVGSRTQAVLWGVRPGFLTNAAPHVVPDTQSSA